MPIESHLPQEEVSIKHLSLEQPESTGLQFDVAKEITEQDWDDIWMMITKAGMQRDEINLPPFRQFNRLASAAKILFPEREEQLECDEVALKRLLQQLGFVKERAEMYSEGSADYTNNWNQFTKLAGNIKILFPNNGKDLNIGDVEWQHIRNAAMASYLNFQWTGTLRMMVAAKYLDPHKDIVDGVNFKWFQEMMEQDIPKNWPEDKGLPQNVCEALAELKLLYPKHNKDIVLRPYQWNAAITQLREDKSTGDWATFVTFARDLKILAAEKAEITEQGVKLTMPEPKINEPTTGRLPEIKKF